MTLSIPLFLTEVQPCSYLDDERAQSLFVHPALPMTRSHYSQLIQYGFRRSGNDVYAPHCPNCSACIPVRLAVADFKANRKQQRCLKKNKATEAILKPAVFSQEQYDLYLRYQAQRHKNGSMAQLSPDEYLRFLSSTWCDTRFVEFSINSELAAVAVIDQLDNAWSAVYTFFDPKFSSFSPGVYAVLWEIEQAKLQHCQFLYLGFWIQHCKKMAYKIEYQPIQLFIDNLWSESPN